MINIEELKIYILDEELPEVIKGLDNYNINEFDKYGNNILHYIIKNIKEIKIPVDQLVQELIKRGIDINAPQTKMYNKTPLHLAVFNKSKPVFDILLEVDAQIDSLDANGNTPLWDAVMNYKGEEGYFIRKLIDKGANTKLKNKHGVSPLSLSKTIANYDSSKFFTKKVK